MFPEEFEKHVETKFVNIRSKKTVVMTMPNPKARNN